MALFITVFSGKANIEILRLLENNRPADLSTVTRMTLKIGDDVFIDSDAYPEAISWSIDTEGSDKGVVTFALGTVLVDYMAMTPGYLTAYDSGAPGGIIWEDDCDDPELYFEVCTAGVP